MAVVHDGVAGVVCVQDPVVGRRAGDWANNKHKHPYRRRWTLELQTKVLIKVRNHHGEGPY